MAAYLESIGDGKSPMEVPMTTPANISKIPPAVPTAPAYKVGKWPAMLHERRLKTPGPEGGVGTLSKAIGNLSGALADQQHAMADAPIFSSEVFGRLYGGAEKIDGASGWSPKAHEILSALPEWEALCNATDGDADISAMATAAMIGEISKRLPQIAPPPPKPGNPSGRGKADPLLSGEGAMRSALRAAIAVAAEKAAEGKEILSGLAPGLDSAPKAHEAADPKRMILAERVAQNPRMKEAMRRAGRILRIADARREVRDETARQEVVDLERGADLARVLPAALAGLRSPNPMLRLLTLRSIAERTALQYRMEGTEKLGRGPIVVLLDESGSMGGDPYLWACATAIAAVGMAAREKRAVILAGFNTGILNPRKLDSAGRFSRLGSDGQEIPGSTEGGIAEMIASIGTSPAGGGTDFSPALRFGLDAGAERDRADLILVTDGCADASPEIRARLAESKTRGLRVIGLTVGAGALSGPIAELCDEAVAIDRPTDGDRAREIGARMPRP
jgi:Mg-chelatase subunit ChlD